MHGTVVVLLSSRLRLGFEEWVHAPVSFISSQPFHSLVRNMKRPAARRASDRRCGSKCKTESCQTNAQNASKFLGICWACFSKRDISAKLCRNGACKTRARNAAYFKGFCWKCFHAKFPNKEKKQWNDCKGKRCQNLRHWERKQFGPLVWVSIGKINKSWG